MVSGVTDGRTGGADAHGSPGSSDVYFLAFFFMVLQQCLAKLCARAYFNGTCIAKIVSLV